MTQPQLDHAEIAQAAYLMWLDEGQPQGRDQDHWLRAVDVLSTPQPKVKKAKAPAKPRAKAKAAAAPKAAKAKTAKAAAPKSRAKKA